MDKVVSRELQSMRGLSGGRFTANRTLQHNTLLGFDRNAQDPFLPACQGCNMGGPRRCHD